MELVYLESPYAGDIDRNLKYARACMADCLTRGESPYASHLLLTQPGILRDNVPEERRLGIEAGFAWARATRAKSVFYIDLGWSSGMLGGRGLAAEEGRAIEIRNLPRELWESLLAENA